MREKKKRKEKKRGEKKGKGGKERRGRGEGEEEKRGGGEEDEKTVENLILGFQTLAQLWLCAIHAAQLWHFVSRKPVATHEFYDMGTKHGYLNCA